MKLNFKLYAVIGIIVFLGSIFAGAKFTELSEKRVYTKELLNIRNEEVYKIEITDGFGNLVNIIYE